MAILGGMGVMASMAECFRANYPDTFIVLDATELCTEIRSCLALQSQLYSSYKSHTTLKDLIGISPNGSIYLVSELWSGSISDRELVIKSVMFCLSKKNFIITFTSSVTFQLFFFFYFLTSFIRCLLICMVASQASCFVFQKKENSNHRIHKHCSLSIPPFLLTSFVFADSDGWFTSIMFSFKKNFFRHIHEHCCCLSLFCFSDTFGFFLVNGSWSHDKLSAPSLVPCCTENISMIEIDHSLHCYHWMHFTKRLWEKVPTSTRHCCSFTKPDQFFSEGTETVSFYLIWPRYHEKSFS